MSVTNIAVLASGGGTNFQAILDAVERGEIAGRVCCLIYNRKAAFAAQRAADAGIPAVYINRKVSGSPEAFQAEINRTLLEYDADVVVLAGWLEILGAETIARFPNRILNTHPALIPSFCGRGMYGHNVHQAVLDFGAKVSGCTVHFADEGVDTGAIVFQQAVDVLPDDTAQTLAARILPHEHRLLTRAVKLLCEGRLQVCGRHIEIILAQDGEPD